MGITGRLLPLSAVLCLLYATSCTSPSAENLRAGPVSKGISQDSQAQTKSQKSKSNDNAAKGNFGSEETTLVVSGEATDDGVAMKVPLPLALRSVIPPAEDDEDVSDDSFGPEPFSSIHFRSQCLFEGEDAQFDFGTLTAALFHHEGDGSASELLEEIEVNLSCSREYLDFALINLNNGELYSLELIFVSADGSRRYEGVSEDFVYEGANRTRIEIAMALVNAPVDIDIIFDEDDEAGDDGDAGEEEPDEEEEEEEEEENESDEEDEEDSDDEEEEEEDESDNEDEEDSDNDEDQEQSSIEELFEEHEEQRLECEEQGLFYDIRDQECDDDTPLADFTCDLSGVLEAFEGFDQMEEKLDERLDDGFEFFSCGQSEDRNTVTLVALTENALKFVTFWVEN